MIQGIVVLLLFGASPLDHGSPDTGNIIDNGFFVVSYNAERKTPFWVAEYLEGKVGSIKRDKFDFYKDDRIKKIFQADPDEYDATGFDKGHQAPAENYTFNLLAMISSFSALNCAPQNPTLNRGQWRSLEQLVFNRSKVNKLWVFTGPVYNNGAERVQYKTLGKTRIGIPCYFFKTVYDGKTIDSWLIPNEAPTKELSEYKVEIDKIEELTGMDFWDKVE